LISVISLTGLLLTSGLLGRAAGGGSKFKSVEFDDELLELESVSLDFDRFIF